MTSDRPRILSTTPSFLAMLERASPQPVTARTWADTYEVHHREVFNSYYSSWGDPRRRDHAAGQAHATGQVLADREARATALVEEVSDQLRNAGLADEPLQAVLMVGVGSSNGWAALHRGAPTLFLALESFPLPPHDRVLVVHEALHTRHTGSEWPQTVAADLWREGLVTALSRRLCPGLADSSYLWFDDGHAAWVHACEAAASTIAGLVGDHLMSANPAIVRELFSTRGGTGVPVRAGYWLGDRLASELLDARMSAADLVTMGFEDSLDLVRAWLAGR